MRSSTKISTKKSKVKSCEYHEDFKREVGSFERQVDVNAGQDQQREGALFVKGLTDRDVRNDLVMSREKNGEDAYVTVEKEVLRTLVKTELCGALYAGE